MENMQQKELLPGATLYMDKYEIQKVLGLGGFGITYLAMHRGFNQSFAIKEFFINGYSMRQKENPTVHLQGMQPEKYQKYKQRFIEEAQLLAKLDHANIIRVIDVFEENETAYFVMPYIKGQTLEKLIESKGQLSYNETINYIAQVAEAVEHVHSKNLLHRDIKPDNIMITPENKIILIDFGSAREFVHDKMQSHTSMLTKGYAPIEQYSTTSKKGNYSDIYALGAVFYVSITGQKPMDAGERMLEIMPEPKELCADIPPEANRAIMKAMSMKPEHRHQTIKEFMDDLLNVESSSLVAEESVNVKSNKTIIIAPTKEESEHTNSSDVANDINPAFTLNKIKMKLPGIISLTLGILGILFFPFSVGAIIMGVIAIKRSKGKTLGIAGIVLGVIFVFFAIWIIVKYYLEQ